MDPSPPAVLAIAAADPSGGAGIQADIQTLAAMGCHPLSVITAITVQNTTGVEDLLAIDADWVADQIRCILEDVPVHAFKLGVLGSVENAAAIAEVISDYPDVPLVIDPVLASARGDELASQDLLEAMKELLLPQCTLATPNIMELHRLAQRDEDEETENLPLAKLADRLIKRGCEFVLVTGTHAQTPEVINGLYNASGLLRSDAWPRLPGSYHGSGCTLAAAIAALLARGLDVSEAVHEAQDFTWQALQAGYRLGMGQHVPDRMFWAREAAQDPESGLSTSGPGSTTDG